jgi:hypothetical protein
MSELEGTQGTADEDVSVKDFFDGLSERIRRQPCPICGVDDWHFVSGPITFATRVGASRADLEVAMAVCKSCRFIRLHMRNPLSDISAWIDVVG